MHIRQLTKENVKLQKGRAMGILACHIKTYHKASRNKKGLYHLYRKQESLLFFF